MVPIEIMNNQRFYIYFKEREQYQYFYILINYIKKKKFIIIISYLYKIVWEQLMVFMLLQMFMLKFKESSEVEKKE